MIFQIQQIVYNSLCQFRIHIKTYYIHQSENFAQLIKSVNTQKNTYSTHFHDHSRVEEIEFLDL